jgi:hypothetical protein
MYKPRTERNSKQLNKTLMEMVRCSPARGWNNTLANKAQYIFYKKKFKFSALTYPVEVVSSRPLGSPLTVYQFYNHIWWRTKLIRM